MTKQNCWEVKKCGRETGGLKALELGICPATLEQRTNGVHGGRNGGRCCWAVTGTLCGGKVQGTYVAKLSNCLDCAFYKSVKADEGHSIKATKDILELLK